MVPNFENKNQGLKGPRQDQDQDFTSQDIKTESWDISRPRLESWQLYHW